LEDEAGRSKLHYQVQIEDVAEQDENGTQSRFRDSDRDRGQQKQGNTG
jgi:hypothetical protein